jgi:hypothetical protein
LASGLATKQASGSYATTPQLGDYATTSALTSGLATKQASGSYATTSALTSGLATKQETISDSAPIALSNVTGLSTALAAKAGQGTPMTCVTEQVTGSSPILTTGATNIDDNGVTFIPFAGSFTAFGINHPSNSTLFNCNLSAEYTVNVQLRVTSGAVNDRGMYFCVLRRYKQRPNNNNRGTFYRDYFLGSSYYRDDTDSHDDIVLGGNVRVHMEAADPPDENFEIVVRRSYQQNPASGDCPLNNSESFITIERHAYEVS